MCACHEASAQTLSSVPGLHTFARFAGEGDSNVPGKAVRYIVEGTLDEESEVWACDLRHVP